MRLALLDSLVEVVAPAPLLDALRSLYGDSGDDDGGPATVRLTLVEGRLSVDGGPPGPVVPDSRQLEELLVAVNAAVIAGVRSFAVHAGAVAGRDGVVAWPGVSGAGKSTLTAACLRAGLRYVSDEALVLSDGSVRPYPKPLSLSGWSLAAVDLPGLPPGAAERPVPPAELGAAVAAPPLALRHLLRLERRPGPPSLRPAEPGALALLVLEHSFNHYKDPGAAFTEATRAARDASCWTLGYDDPGAAAALLAEQLG